MFIGFTFLEFYSVWLEVVQWQRCQFSQPKFVQTSERIIIYLYWILRLMTISLLLIFLRFVQHSRHDDLACFSGQFTRGGHCFLYCNVYRLSMAGNWCTFRSVSVSFFIFFCGRVTGLFTKQKSNRGMIEPNRSFEQKSEFIINNFVLHFCCLGG